MLGSRKIVMLALLGLLALGLRVWVVVAISGEHAGPLTFEHGHIADNLLQDQGFAIEYLGTEGPTSQQAPFYPMLLAAAYCCLGSGSPAAILAVQLLQCVIGAALVLVVVWLGWSLAPGHRSIGWVAGIGAALYPTHLYMVSHLQVATWAAFLLTLLIAVVVSPRWKATRGGAIIAGTISGCLLLVEPILSIALPICATAFWMAEGTGTWKSLFARGPIYRLALMAGIAAAIITPWTIRNYLAHGQFVFIKSTFGYALWQGNNPISWGTDKIPKESVETIRNLHNGTLAGINRAMWDARHETLYIDDVLLSKADYEKMAKLTEPDRSKLLGRRAINFIVAEPWKYARLCLQRLRYFLLFDETNPKAANRLYRITTAGWLVLIFLGLILSRGHAKMLWPTYAIFAAVMVFHTLVIVSARFRIPLEPMSFVWASWAITPVVVRLFGRKPIQIHRPGDFPRDPFSSDHSLQGPHFRIPTPTRQRRAG